MGRAFGGQIELMQRFRNLYRQSHIITIAVEKQVGMVGASRTTPEPAAARPMFIGSAAWLSGYRQ